MRTLIFTFLLLTLNAFGAPQPTTYLNAWTTNRSVLPVFGDNNLSVSNRIAGAGGGTSWNFYGISPNTVARLKDATNIANAIVTNAIASSNGNYVLKYNGTASGLTETNGTNIGLLNLVRSGNGLQLGFVDPIGDPTFDIYAYVESGALYITNQDSGFLARLDGGGWFSQQFDAIQIFQINGNTVISENPSHTLNLGQGPYWTHILIGPESTGTSNNGSFETSGPSTNWVNATFKIPSASKLAAFDANKVITNSVYSDADISALQAGIANTGAFVRVQSGTMNNVTSTNGNFISPTNQPGASNMVAMTVNGVVGQTNNLVEWGTNGVRRGRIEAAGHLISDGYVASTNGLINTNIAGHFWRTENLGNGFTWSLDFDGSTMISVNNSANINASSISMNGSTLSDSSKNITALTGNFKGGILCSNITITNVINLASLSNLTYTNALCATIWNSNNVGIWVRSTNNTDKLLLAIP